MKPRNAAERHRIYLRILESFLRRLDLARPRIHLPAPSPLRRQQPGMFFHLTPELFLQVDGCNHFTCPSGSFKLAQGEIALIPRGVPHGEKGRHGRKPFKNMVVCFRESQLTLIVSSLEKDGAAPRVEFVDLFDGPQISSAIRWLDDASALRQDSPTLRLQRQALIFTCLASLHDLLTSPRTQNQQESGPDPKVSQCQELIRVGLNNPSLTVASLARQIGCTSDHLSRCFRRETGMPVWDYLRKERLSRAQNLLQEPGLNISEIAWACGFNSLNYFVRAFRQAMGKSPGKFRKQLPLPAPAG